MKKAFLIFATTFLCASYAFAQNSSMVLKVLSQKDQKVKWNASSWIAGDFDYDGVDDYALRGRKGKLFILGVVKGMSNNRSKSWTLEFGESSDSDGGLCSVSKARIMVSKIDSNYKDFAKEYLEDEYAKRMAILPKGSKAIKIDDGMCDPFNIFWDKKVKKFVLWRV